MINITPFKQTDDSRCGPACIKMILNHYNIEVSEDEVCLRCNHTYELGCTDYQMKKAIESYGLKCRIDNNCTFRDIEDWVKQYEIPVIVDWFTPGVNPSLGDMGNGHSSIVDIDSDYIYLMDPELGDIRKIQREEFLRVWFDWREDSYLQRCDDLVLRQIIVIYQ
jgi:predicted double-glycine peptidase